MAEILAGGRLVILPPTLHPATGHPYVWLTPATLLDIAPAELPSLDAAAIAALFEPSPQPPRRRKYIHSPREAARQETLIAALAYIPAGCDYQKYKPQCITCHAPPTEFWPAYNSSQRAAAAGELGPSAPAAL